MSRIIQVITGFFIGLACLTVINVHDVQANVCPRRAYAIANLTNVSDYTTVSGKISYGTPTIRDGGFSAEVLWIGGEDTNYVEMGWRKDVNENNGVPILYWGFVDQYNEWHYYPLTTNRSTHDFKIRHNPHDNRWHVYIDGRRKGQTPNGAVTVSSGTISAGGEVTDCSSQHNAMGISNFTDLKYKRNHGSTQSWNGWTDRFESPGYNLIELGSDSFQTRGYNP